MENIKQIAPIQAIAKLNKWRRTRGKILKNQLAKKNGFGKYVHSCLAKIQYLSTFRIRNSQFTMGCRTRERALLILDLIFIAKDEIRIETDGFSRIYVIIFRLVNAFSRVIHIGFSALALALALPSSFHFVFHLFFSRNDESQVTKEWRHLNEFNLRLFFSKQIRQIRQIQFKFENCISTLGPENWERGEKKTFCDSIRFDHNKRFAIIILCICVKTKIFLSNTFFVLFSLFEWNEISRRVLTKKKINIHKTTALISKIKDQNPNSWSANYY